VVVDSWLRDANTLTLQWHEAALTLELEAFRSWCLATLKARLRFDGAIWGVQSAAEVTSGRRINSACTYRIADDVIERLEEVRIKDFAQRRPAGRALNICLSDETWSGTEQLAMREHGRRYGLLHTLSMRLAETNMPGHQFILLSRKSVGQRFSLEETSNFELLAPHMMQAFATCRRVYLGTAQTGDRRVAPRAVAMVDRAGVIHDSQAGFLPLLRREWSDWPGERLPEPLLELTARRCGTRWRFLGQQVAADFVPVDDLCLVTLRPRHTFDALTPRESEVAHLYAAGGKFREIAQSLQLAPATVRSHLRNVFGKLGVRNKSQLAAALR
jgi:DNA-binding CsgD family transcriptional regulator